MWSCAVTYGFAPHTLEQAQPDVTVDSPRELPLIFKNLPLGPDDDAETPGTA